MVFALSQFAAAKLSADAADHTKFRKEYVAVVSGKPDEEAGIFEDFLFKDSSKNKTYVVKKERRGVKKAKLWYKTVAELEDNTFVRVKLFTGRTHQIRVQFASRKMPVLGDRKYGGLETGKGIALRSVLLEFKHPISGETLRFEKVPDINELI
jgi:23S rRNA pseudouridine1911/1915/1917 synthase